MPRGRGRMRVPRVHHDCDRAARERDDCRDRELRRALPPDHLNRMIPRRGCAAIVAREMSHSVAPPPARQGDYASLGQLMGWMVLLGLAFWPRLFILGFWIFDRQFRHAFDSWVLLAIGFLVLPWTTIAYAFMW